MNDAITHRGDSGIMSMQRTMLPELVALDLFAAPPRLAVPVHCVFGEQDALLPATVVKDLPAAIIAPACTAVSSNRSRFTCHT